MDPIMEDRSEVVFFDLETTVPDRRGQGCAIVEFGAILVCPKKLVEVGEPYSSLVRPSDFSLIPPSFVRRNGITHDALITSPTFLKISDKVFDLLNGRIWAGHNILGFDCELIMKAFEEIGKTAPEPRGIIDSLELLTQKFGRRAGDMKMASLANYFGLGQQSHRSLDDVRMNLEVLKHCATVLFLESSLPDILTTDCWVSPDEVDLPSISASLVLFYGGGQKIKILHNDVMLQLCATDLTVRFGISTSFIDHAGRRSNIVVDASPSLCRVLDACDDLAETFMDSGSSSEWKPVVTRQNNRSTVRLKIPTVVNEGVAMYATEIYYKESSGAEQRFVFSRNDAAELDDLLVPGTFVDAYISLDSYDNQQNAGIGLVAKKLVLLHST